MIFKKKSKVVPTEESQNPEADDHPIHRQDTEFLNHSDQESEEEDPDIPQKTKRIKYEPLMKLPRLEFLVDWDWNPKN